MTNHGEGENKHFHRFHGYDYSRGAIVGFRAWIVALFVIFVWGVTFANTRALLADFSALEILVVRFALAWGALWLMSPRRLR